VSDAARSAAASPAEAVALALGGGDDYELCFASPAGAMDDRADEFERTFGTRVTRVGTIREGQGVTAIAADGTERPLDVHGWSHFAATGATTTRGGA
jgi:thiamine-monophosphate kinase